MAINYAIISLNTKKLVEFLEICYMILILLPFFPMVKTLIILSLDFFYLSPFESKIEIWKFKINF